jgi:electron transfer flavoprotein alpha subunit
VRRVLLAEHQELRFLPAEHVAATLTAFMADYETVLGAATSSARNALPRVAAMLGVMQVSDVIAIDDARTFRRPIYAGNAIETVRCPAGKMVLTIRASAFAAADDTASACPIEPVTASLANRSIVVLEQSEVNSDRPNLSTSRIVVSGGRALGSKEKFEELLFPLAERLSAAVGASRAAVDAGYASNDLQVGQTGKIVAPSLYIAIGISGAVQHLAGIGGAKIVVAINSDADAPIFRHADYGLVGDLFVLVPELTAALAPK